MELVLEGNNEALQLRIIGELVTETCGELRQTVMETVSREPKKIVLDLKEVPFIDTSGIGVIVGLRAHMKSRGIGLELANPSPKVKQVLRMTRLLSVFGLEED